MFACLQSSPGAPPRNALAARPDIARLISLYWMSKSFGVLPDPGGLLDQRADTFAYFTVFAAAQAEYEYQQQSR